MLTCVANLYIEQLGMKPHPEGGHYIETFKAADGSYSSIYYLLEKNEVSHFHVLQEDEIWYFHAGASIDIYEIDTQGVLTVTTLGKLPVKGEVFQHVVKAGTIFGAKLTDESSEFSLVGCMVSPAFTYDHFTMSSKEELLAKFPQHSEIIEQLTQI